MWVTPLPPACKQENDCSSVPGMESHGSGSSCPGLRGGGTSCGLAPAPHGRSWGVTPATASRLMVRANFSSREKMPFSFLSVLFLTWLQWDWSAQHPKGRGSQFLNCARLPGRVRSMRAQLNQSVLTGWAGHTSPVHGRDGSLCFQAKL